MASSAKTGEDGSVELLELALIAQGRRVISKAANGEDRLAEELEVIVLTYALCHASCAVEVEADPLAHSLNTDLLERSPHHQASGGRRVLQPALGRALTELIKAGAGVALHAASTCHVGRALQGKGAAEETGVSHEDCAAAHGNSKPLVGVDDKGVDLAQIAKALSNARVEHAKAPIGTVHMKPEGASVSDLTQRVEGLNLTHVNITRSSDHGDGRGACSNVGVDGTGDGGGEASASGHGDATQGVAAKAEGGQGSRDRVMGALTGVDAGLMKAGEAFGGGVKAEALSSVLTRGTESEEVGHGATAGEAAAKVLWKSEELSEPAKGNELQCIGGVDPPALRGSDGGHEVGSRGDHRSCGGDPATEAGLSQRQGVCCDLFAQECENGVCAQSFLGERQVEQGLPEGAEAGGVPGGRKSLFEGWSELEEGLSQA